MHFNIVSELIFFVKPTQIFFIYYFIQIRDLGSILWFHLYSLWFLNVPICTMVPANLEWFVALEFWMLRLKMVKRTSQSGVGFLEAKAWSQGRQWTGHKTQSLVPSRRTDEMAWMQQSGVGQGCSQCESCSLINRVETATSSAEVSWQKLCPTFRTHKKL